MLGLDRVAAQPMQAKVMPIRSRRRASQLSISLLPTVQLSSTRTKPTGDVGLVKGAHPCHTVLHRLLLLLEALRRILLLGIRIPALLSSMSSQAVKVIREAVVHSQASPISHWVGSGTMYGWRLGVNALLQVRGALATGMGIAWTCSHGSADAQETARASIGRSP